MLLIMSLREYQNRTRVLTFDVYGAFSGKVTSGFNAYRPGLLGPAPCKINTDVISASTAASYGPSSVGKCTMCRDERGRLVDPRVKQVQQTFKEARSVPPTDHKLGHMQAFEHGLKQLLPPDSNVEPSQAVYGLARGYNILSPVCSAQTDAVSIQGSDENEENLSIETKKAEVEMNSSSVSSTCAAEDSSFEDDQDDDYDDNSSQPTGQRKVKVKASNGIRKGIDNASEKTSSPANFTRQLTQKTKKQSQRRPKKVYKRESRKRMCKAETPVDRGAKCTWSENEQEACIALLVDIQTSWTGKFTIDALWQRVSEEMISAGFNRTPHGVKNYWSRYGRIRSGYDERSVKRPEAMVTGALDGTKVGRRISAKNPIVSPNRIMYYENTEQDTTQPDHTSTSSPLLIGEKTEDKDNEDSKIIADTSAAVKEEDDDISWGSQYSGSPSTDNT